MSRAIARDLRRRYGEAYRVLRADDGAAALDALRELAGRGEETALLLADHRMPGMTGVEFLEQAMDVVPGAKRVLLTAYAETDAAIRAINEVDLDRYLLKPWDPPEERLYPVLDDLLGAWTASRRREGPDGDVPRLLGSRWSAESHDARDLLTRNGVPHRFLDVERDPEGRRLLASAGLQPDAVPVLLVPGRPPLARPDRQALASAVGLPTALRDDVELSTSSSSVPVPPGSGPRSTAPARAWRRWCWSPRRRAARPGSPAASRTTSASPAACPAASWPSARWRRPSGSTAASCWRPT